jgi:hypothetical protein
MPTRNNPSPAHGWPVLIYTGVPLLVTAFLWATGSNQLSVTQFFTAFVLCWIAWASYQQWYRGTRQEIPLFSLIAAMYWLTYAVPLFWSSDMIGLVTGPRRISESALIWSMYLVVIGVLSLWAGMTVARNWRWSTASRLDVPQNPWRWHYLRMVLVGGALLKVLVPITALGEGGRQLLVNIESIVPSVTFVILLRYYLRGKAIGADRVLLAGYFLVALVVGLSSGWLGTFVGLGIICIAAYVLEKRKFPVTAILVVLPIVLFLQPGKAKFREKYWQSGPKESYSENYGERIGFWIEASSRAWAHALTDVSGDGLRKLSSDTLIRLSLLQQTGNVIEMTPSRVPYQNGRLYSYVLVTFIPRFVWPEKPSISDANKWYQVSYHLTLPANIESVGIAVGAITESYINFGWFGPAPVMFCLGLVVGVFQAIFLRTGSGLLLGSIGVALLPGLLSVESQMAVYVAGLVQQILFALIVLAPVLELRSNDDRRHTRRVLPHPPMTSKG